MANKLERRDWTKDDHKKLRQHSKNKTPTSAVAKDMKRTAGAVYQQASKLGIPIGASPKKKAPKAKKRGA